MTGDAAAYAGKEEGNGMRMEEKERENLCRAVKTGPLKKLREAGQISEAQLDRALDKLRAGGR